MALTCSPGDLDVADRDTIIPVEEDGGHCLFEKKELENSLRSSEVPPFGDAGVDSALLQQIGYV